MSVELSTHWLGISLRNPLVAGASPLTGDLGTLMRLEEAGAAAVVLPSLFEEQIEHEEEQVARLREFGSESFAEALDYFPALEDYNTGPDHYLDLVRQAKERLQVPVIASLNGHTAGGWVRYARLIQDAGADGLELNAYFVPTDPDMSGAEVEQRYLDLVQAVREAVTIPLAVKIGPVFSSLPHMARRLEGAGAQGLVLFNRFLEPDIDLESLKVVPHLHFSHRTEAGLPLRWIAILREHLDITLAASTGVHDSDTAVKMVLAGADVVMLASVLLQRGPEYLSAMLQGLSEWLEENDYVSVEQARGSMSRRNCPDASAFERGNYMRALTSYTGEPI